MSKVSTDKFLTKNAPDVITNDNGRVQSIRPKSNKTKHRQAALLKALEITFGIVSKAAELSGCDRNTYYAWYNNDPEFKKRADDIQNFQIEFVESKLLARIADGDTTAIIFYLRTKGKDKGYKLEEKENEKPQNFAITINERVVEALPQPVEETPAVVISSSAIAPRND